MHIRRYFDQEGGRKNAETATQLPQVPQVVLPLLLVKITADESLGAS